MRNNIIDFFEKYSNLEFIIDSNDGRVYSYSDILRMSISLNNNLCDLSINSRSRVLIVLDHSVDFLVSILACAIGGHIACPVNPELFDKKLSLYKKLIGYDFVINKDSYKSISKKNNCKKMPAVNKDDNDFLILPSSGTTSDSKFIVLGIRTMLDSAISFSKLTNSTKKSRYIHNMPMYYMAGIFNLFFVPMVSGSSVVIESRTGPALLIDYWSNQYRHHVNRLILTPTVAYSVSRMERDVERISNMLKTYEMVISTGSILYESIRSIFNKTYSHNILSCYGVTELGGSLTIQNDNSHLLPFNVGFHKSGIHVKINKTSGQTFGRVLIKTPFMFKGYLKNSEKKITVDSEGYFDTGDIGEYKDQQLFIYGRDNDSIKKGGEFVNLTNVENAAIQCQKVKEAAA
ncbi:MAG TPA: long-chain fatty acid--CoA ligase, partial [Candidatus Thioglobus sp.]|nr:long-chain fatty acid--CoA ligase [Candidatus Thioglobus sp.]